MVLVKKWPFFDVFFFSNIGQENVFYNILEQKNAFLAYKNNRFKKSKNWDFSKGVNPWFWSKNGHFSMSFFFCNIGQENVFYNILERKNAFLAHKKRSSKSRKIEIFPKGLTHGFGQKMAIFASLFFRQYRPGKCVLQYSRKPLFPSRISIKIYFKAYFFRKTNNGKIYNFWPKPWTNPFWKIQNLQYLTKIVKLKIQFFVNFLKSFFISLESLSFHLFWKPYNGKFPIFEENRWPSPLG